MGAPQAAAMGLVNRAQPSLNPDAIEQEVRLGRYREQYVLPLFGGHFGAADEGAYFVGSTPTPGTAVAFAVSNAVSETAGYYFCIRNSDSSGGTNKRIYMDFLRLIMSATVPASGNAGHYFLKIDTNMVTTAGSTVVPVNTNGDASGASIAQVNIGANTTAARTSNARLVDRGVLRSVIPVANDEWVFKFGGVEAPGSGSLGGTVALRMAIPVPPVILAAGQSLGLQMWFPSNASTAGQFEVVAGWWER